MRYNSILHPAPGSIVDSLVYDDMDNVVEHYLKIIPDDIQIRYRNTYDYIGRHEQTYVQITTSSSAGNGSTQVWPEQKLSELQYTVKELTLDKVLGDNLQDIDYSYKPNRLLENINGNAGVQLSNGDLWSQSIVYADDQNIERTAWRDATVNSLRVYTYTYDFLKRITAAAYTGLGGTGAYSTTYGYKDLRGNINQITRMSGGSMIDDLNFTYYSGTNQIQDISDGVSIPTEQKKGFKANSTDDYIYDDNGAMTYDQGRAIDFQHNHLNLPYQIEVPDSSGMVMYYYTGDGVLHRQEEIRDSIVYKVRDYIGGVEYVNGGIEQITHSDGYITIQKDLTADHLQLSGSESSNQTYKTISTISDRMVPSPRVTEYLSEEMIILTPGFEVSLHADFLADIDTFPITGLEYRYFLKDHLGSVRVEFKDDGTGTAVTTNVTNYYPFGLPWEDDTDTRNNWTYTGQELQRSFDLGLMNYGARFYDPAIGRFPSVDPLAHKRPGLSPYNYVQNNPIMRIDPTGMLDTIPGSFTGKPLPESAEKTGNLLTDTKNAFITTAKRFRWLGEEIGTGIDNEVLGGAVQETMDGDYSKAAFSILLARLKLGKAEGLAKKLLKHGKDSKLPTPKLNPNDFKPGNTKRQRVHKETGAIFEKSHTSHRNKGNVGEQWKIWPKGTKSFGKNSVPNRITVDGKGNIIGN
jgi:RHS repeat-associated protein